MPSKDYTAIRVHKSVVAFIAEAQKARGLSSPNETLCVLFNLPRPQKPYKRPVRV